MSGARPDGSSPYAVVFEEARRKHSVYVPRQAGCIVNGETLAGAEEQIREAISFHIKGLRADGSPIPTP